MTADAPMRGSRPARPPGRGVARAAPLLTVIVPVFNEAGTLRELLRQVLNESTDKQVVVVDDGSTDGTASVLEELKSEAPIEHVRHVENRGKGAAIRTALPLARGRFTIVQDGDLELCPADYGRLLEPLLSGEAELVIGERQRDSRRWSLFNAGAILLNLSVRVLYGVRIGDEPCGYKVLSTNLLRSMNLCCERFEFCPEVVAKACRLGLRIADVPVRYFPRRAVEGKKLRYRDGLAALWTLWRLRNWTQGDPLTHIARTATDASSSPVAVESV